MSRRAERTELLRTGNNDAVGDQRDVTRVVAVLCADLARTDNGDSTESSSVIDGVIRRHGGDRIDGPASAAVVLLFPLASAAIRAALDMRANLGVRVSVDVSEQAHDGTCLVGDVDRCSGLLDAANDGQVIASSAAWDLARSAVVDEVEATDLGVHHVRGWPGRVWIWQLDPRGSPTSFPVLRTRDAVASTLPTPATSFVGREADVAALAELIDAHRVVSIVGAGGCGKTRLAVEVAVEILGRFRDGVAWADLAPLTESTAVTGVVGGAVGLQSVTEITAERISEHLGGRSMLIILDNCEHVADATGHLVAAITASCPSVRIVATSREPLALAPELVWRIPSLPVPLRADGSDLLDSEAGRLLVERIRLIRPDFEPDHTEATALAEVCRRLDGIPLAIELAAARTATMSPVELAGRLGERFGLLVGGARDTIARQRTLEASVAWSYQLLTDDEQCCFRRLSVFSGSFALDAAVRMCSGAVADPEGSIVRLAACSLVVERAGPGTRLQMLEPIRWFARERLIDSGDADEVLGQHLAWAVDTARQLGGELEGPRVTETVARLDADVDNLRAAMDWAIGQERLGDAVGILAATSWYWVWRGRLIEMERWLGRSGLDDADLEPHDRLNVLWAKCELTWIQGRGIGDLVADAVSLASDVGDTRVEAKFLVSQSRLLAFTDPHGTIERAPQEREMCRCEGLPFWFAISLVSEVRANFSLGRFDRAESLLDQLKVESRALRHPQLIADEISRRALLDRHFGRYEAVRRAVAEIDEVTKGFTSLNSQALVHAEAALVDVALGKAESALVAMDELYRRYTIAGEYGFLPSIALPIIDALIDLGRPTEAIERSDQVWRGSGSVSWRLRLGNARATALLAAGDVESARAAFTAVVDEARVTPNEHEAAIADRFLAVIDRSEQRFADAETRLHRALETQAGFGYPQYVADGLEELAGIELEHDRAQPAAVLFGAAARIRTQSGVTRRIGRQDAYDADIEELRRRLGDELAQPWERGAALTLHDAVALAQRGRGERGRPATGWESLTVTEVKVAALVAEGHTNPEIAERLVMGRATVKTHVSNILRKLGLTNRTQLAGRAAQRGTK
jgi:predicted ATPase/DNA-binding CsgD family transcriptional regulator